MKSPTGDNYVTLLSVLKPVSLKCDAKRYQKPKQASIPYTALRTIDYSASQRAHSAPWIGFFPVQCSLFQYLRAID